MPIPSLDRLVRFKNPSGHVFYGAVPDKESSAQSLKGQSVSTYKGEYPWGDDFEPTGAQETIEEVLCPIPSMPIGYGAGVNYQAHSQEAGLSAVDFPLVFTKTPGSLAGPFDDVPLNKALPDIDYEGELTVVMGRECKDLKDDEDPAAYILGYTVGNDVSSRYWQDPKRCGGQHGYAKSFDKFAPIGPVLVSTTAIPDPKQLTMKTRVNGEQRQMTRTDDLIFDIPALIRHISRGTTLHPGTIIMTGTPSGVGAFMKPATWLKDGDIVEVEISQIGTLRNRMVADK
ncbi:hypothetical protein LTS17_007745 [Exophiala oligosperma]